jgi:hypothetical protein
MEFGLPPDRPYLALYDHLERTLYLCKVIHGQVEALWVNDASLYSWSFVADDKNELDILQGQTSLSFDSYYSFKAKWRRTHMTFSSNEIGSIPVFIFEWENDTSKCAFEEHMYPVEVPEPFAQEFHDMYMETYRVFLTYSRNVIPRHLYYMAIERAIEKKEDCIVTFDAITWDNAVMTSCGHVFSKDGLEKALACSDKCPVCRAICILLPPPSS